MPEQVSHVKIPNPLISMASAGGALFTLNIGLERSLDRVPDLLEFSARRGAVIGLGYSAIVGTARYLKKFTDYPSGRYVSLIDEEGDLEKPKNLTEAQVTLNAFEADLAHYRQRADGRAGAFVNNMLVFIGLGRHEEDIALDIAEARNNLAEVWNRQLGYEPDL